MASRNDPLKRYLKVQRDKDRELETILERAARDARAQINRLPPGVGGRTRRAQLDRVVRAVKTAQMNLWRDDVTGVVVSGREEAMEAAEDAADALLDVLYASVPERYADRLSDGVKAAAREGMQSDAARVPKELSKSVYRNGVLHSGEV